ncbi:hypothetical protein M9H77_18233 [Catharanthus roseus]|uniref:Uncharacterized protein n=1 Tax=Catharanthus roseus TaxID=4058 RepID=A0ACC0B6V9_CATRO|nr:hypothetical protein M9H77_18233 [Catharanthus roseus]
MENVANSEKKYIKITKTQLLEVSWTQARLERSGKTSLSQTTELNSSHGSGIQKCSVPTPTRTPENCSRFWAQIPLKNKKNKSLIYYRKIFSSSGYTSPFSSGETHPKTSRKNPLAKITETTREKPRSYLRRGVRSSGDTEETRTGDGAEQWHVTEAASRHRRP